MNYPTENRRLNLDDLEDESDKKIEVVKIETNPDNKTAFEETLGKPAIINEIQMRTRDKRLNTDFDEIVDNRKEISNQIPDTLFDNPQPIHN